ncbi:hypothetical protein LCGC14_2340880 [marine sediment metagenome]|uniref:CBS domain-containing protein n=1 Tax=marine sediment metagenome TaxID=412755 RepID=A0A0F9EPT4_9ZZZZ
MAFGSDRQTTFSRAVDGAVIDEGLRSYMLRVYNYMASGLALVVVYIVARTVGKLIASRWAALRFRRGEVTPRIGQALLCQAGVAFGLVTALESMWPNGEAPQWVSDLYSVVLGAIAVFELAGPLLLKRTIVAAGEVKAFRLIHLPSDKPGAWQSLREGTVSLLRRLRIMRLPPAHQGPLRARHVMHTNVKCLPPGANMDEVLHFVERSSLDHFPVVDDMGKFIGTINLADVRDMIYQPALRDLVAAQDLLEDDRVTASADETLHELFEKFREHNARDLIILDEDSSRMLGIVEQRDVLRAMHFEETGQKPSTGH